MEVQTLLLGFLMRGSHTGYELKQDFAISFSFFSGLSYGSIYPALKKMAQAGLVSMQQTRQDHAPDRKVYTITPQGRDAFLAALRSPFLSDNCKSPFLMRLFFFADLAPDERQAMVQAYLETVRKQYQELEAVQPQVEQQADRFQYLCFQFGLQFYKDLAARVEQVLDALAPESTTDSGRKEG